jgi:hypothetical protein
MLDLPRRDGCPPDVAETAEAYYMRKLPPAQAKRFGDHYPMCRRCSLSLEEAGTFDDAMHVALKDAENGRLPP